MEVANDVEICGPVSTSLPLDFGDILDECLTYIQSFLAVRSVHGHDKNSSKENGCNPLFESPFSLGCETLIRTHSSGEPQFATMTHVPKHLQFGYIPGSPLLKRKDDKQMCVRKHVSAIFPQSQIWQNNIVV